MKIREESATYDIETRGEKAGYKSHKSTDKITIVRDYIYFGLLEVGCKSQKSINKIVSIIIH